MEIILGILAFFGITGLAGGIARRGDQRRLHQQMRDNPGMPERTFADGSKLYVEQGSCSAFVGAYAEKYDPHGNLVESGYIPIDENDFHRGSGWY